MSEHLRAGVETFQAEAFETHRARFAELASGQSPPTLFITCADSRIDPSLITQTGPGELFVVRNAGNIVPAIGADGSSADGTAASIEYAVAALGVAHIVVCGHSSCGAMGGLADRPSVASLPSVDRWLEHSAPLVAEGAPTRTLPELIEANVILQLENLKTYPAIAARLSTGDTELHGWVYDIGSGAVLRYDGEAFVPIA